MDTTSESLLIRLREPDPKAAWDRFVRLYHPLLLDWGRRSGLQPDDAADLAQDVLVTLLGKLPAFKYDGNQSFRGWLRTVTLNHCRDRAKRRATRPLPGADDRLDGVAAGSDLSGLIEREYQGAVAARALEVMRAEFHPRIWKACWEHAVAGRAAVDVAADLGMTSGAVYAATYRVLARVRQELTGFWE